MHLHEVVDPGLLQQMLDEKYIRVRTDEGIPVSVYDYTESAQFSRTWNPATLSCRGLVVHSQTGEVLARPMPKFFNYGETGAPELSGPVEVYDKMDGSCGILYPNPEAANDWRIATRGSTASPQALVGTEILKTKYASFVPTQGWTYIFEIIAPLTRVVLNYGITRDLFFICAIETATGRTIPFEQGRATWPGPAVEKFSYPTLTEALSAPPRENAEGYVVLDPLTGDRVKIKQEDYKSLHGLITGLRMLDLWEMLFVQSLPNLAVKDLAAKGSMSVEKAQGLRDAQDISQSSLWERVPDEMYGHVLKTLEGIKQQVQTEREQILQSYTALGLDSFSTRKEQAKVISQKAPDKYHQSAWFVLLSGGDITPMIFQKVKPDPFSMVMDTAETGPVWGAKPSV